MTTASGKESFAAMAIGFRKSLGLDVAMFATKGQTTASLVNQIEGGSDDYLQRFVWATAAACIDPVAFSKYVEAHPVDWVL